MIFPIIIWPFLEQSSTKHCEALINFFASLSDDRVMTPTIVVNQHSKKWIEKKQIQKIVSLNWQIKWVWSVDTCQTWLDAFATSHQSYLEKLENDTLNTYKQNLNKDKICSHLLVPADFHYNSKDGENALYEMVVQFDNMLSSRFDLNIGQLNSRNESFKNLVDKFGTWKLLNLWFPDEARVILKSSISHPRSEFIALSDQLLVEMLNKRWFPYSQTIIFILRMLHAGNQNRINVYELGNLIEDLPSDPFKEFVIQIERIDRALKTYWIDSKSKFDTWISTYSEINKKSNNLQEKVLHDASKIFQ